MSAPFVISMKIVGDGSSAVATTDAVVQGLDHVGDAMDAQRVRALELVQAEREIVRLGREMVNIPAVSKVQTGINQVTGVGLPGRSSAQAAADIEAYGRQMDDLRAKYNPLFAAERAHEEIIRDIQRAYRVGAISSDEMAAAIAREAKAHELLTQRIQQETGAKQQNNSAGLQAFNTANAAAQFQDVAVTAAMGMNPIQIGLQQGTQLAMVLQSSLGDKGAGGAVKVLFTSLMALVSPLSLITIGMVALGAVGIQAFMGMANGAKSADEVLKGHADLVAKIKAAYGEALRGAEDYARQSPLLLVSASRKSSAELEVKFREEREAFLQHVAVLFADADGVFREDYRPKVDFAPFWTEIQKLRSEMAAGKPDFDAFYAAVNAKVGDDPKLRKVADDLILSTTAAREFAMAMAESARNTGVVADNVSQMFAPLAAMRTSPFLQQSLDWEVEGQRAAARHSVEMDAINAKGPAQLADIARRRAALDLDGQAISESLKLQKVQEAGALAYAQASRGIADGERMRLMALRDSVSAARLDLEVIGKSAEETERLRFVRQNLAAAEQAAAQAGTTVSAAYRAEIEKLGAAYGSLRSQVQIYSMAQDLAFERAQLGRSDIEQKVASQLRPIFGDDLTGSQAQFLAQQIRINQTLTEANDIGKEFTRGFLSDLGSGLRDGSSWFEAFGNAGANAFDKLAERALNAAADGLWDMLFGAVSSGLTGGLTGGYRTAADYGFGKPMETGGWTGGIRGRVAGVVHGEEFVVKAGPAAANRAVLEAMNSGRSIGGGSSVTFAPVNQFSVPGGEADIPTYERMLDERDRRLTSQFQDLVEAHLENPMRKWG